jgi:hypothetical protein
VAESIAPLVEQYRVRLGLLPWAEHAALSPEPPRRTGRTLHALLTTLAAFEPARIIGRFDGLMVHAGGVAAEDDAVWQARDAIAKLGLGLYVRRGREQFRYRHAACVYVHHYDHTYLEGRCG